MSTNRLKIILKGTLESEDSNYIQSFKYSNNSQASATAIEDSSNTNDSVDEVIASSDDRSPSKLMIDIAEIRLDDKKISNYRQILTIPLDDSHPFFNGEGIELKTDDPGNGNFDKVKIYIRKMAFNNAMIYSAKGSGFSDGEEAEFVFHEDDTEGFDFNQLMVNSYWDSLREESDELIRIFPMKIPIVGGLKYDRDNDETVLEIRLVIKNYIKKYEYDYYDDGDYKVCHYYAPSDWLRDVRAGESDIGRNLHAVARSFVPGKTASVTVNSTSGYVVAIPASERLSAYYISKNGKLIRDDVKGDLPMPPSYPGSYIKSVLDYYLKYENYKNEWNEARSALANETAAGCTDSDYECKYEYYWDLYESEVERTSTGLKIPPYIAYRDSANVTFKTMAPGTYKFYRFDNPSYGELFLQSDFTTSSNYLGEFTISAGDDTTIP